MDGRLYLPSMRIRLAATIHLFLPLRVDWTTNYIRNSIKVVVNAYNGDVNYYVVDDKWIRLQRRAKIYPTLFKGVDKIPSTKKHFKYPSTLLNIQAGA